MKGCSMDSGSSLTTDFMKAYDKYATAYNRLARKLEKANIDFKVLKSFAEAAKEMGRQDVVYQLTDNQK